MILREIIIRTIKAILRLLIMLSLITLIPLAIIWIITGLDWWDLMEEVDDIN